MNIWKIPDRPYRAGTFKENAPFDITLKCIEDSKLASDQRLLLKIVGPFDYDLVGRVISGTTEIVDTATTKRITVNAILEERTTGSEWHTVHEETRTIEFVIQPEMWDQLHNGDLGVLNESTETEIVFPTNTYKDISSTTFQVISGSLPAGLVIQGNKIVGVPVEVARKTSTKFVIRATTLTSAGASVADKTFSLTVVGADQPVWATPLGALKIGANYATFILDSSYVDFQLQAIDQDASAGQDLYYTLVEQDGELPPGLVLSPTGRISGFVQPLQEIPFGFTGTYDTATYETAGYDLGFRTSNGYDRWSFDQATYDLATQSLLQKKINRKYAFTVSVTDGDTVTKRPFSIYVVGGDHFRADSDAHQIGEGAFTADTSYVKAPIWTTPANLGIRRADNFHVFKLDVYEDPLEPYPVVYNLDTVNPDISGYVSPIFESQSTPFIVAISRNSLSYTLDSITWSTIPIVRNRAVFVDEIGRAVTVTSNNSIILSTASESQEISLARSLTAANEVTNIRVKIEDELLKVSVAGSAFDLAEIMAPFEPTNIVHTAGKFIAFGKNGKIVESINGSDWVFKDSGTTAMFEFVLSFVSNTSEIQLKKTGGRNPVVNDLIQFSKYVDASTSVRTMKVTRVTQVNQHTFNLNLDTALPFTLPTETFVSLGSASTLPPGMQFDQGSGEVLGTIPYMPAVSKEYAFTITATRLSDSYEQAASSRTFKVKLIGEIESVIEWVTPSDLGEIQAETTSTLSVSASTKIEGAPLLYKVTAGELPPGMSLTPDGDLVGKVSQYKIGYHSSGLTSFESGFSLDGGSTTVDRSFVFTVTASDLSGSISSTRTFRLQVTTELSELFCNVYVQPFTSEQNRNELNNFLSSPEIFAPTSIYRANDPEFGVQKTPKILIFAGVELVDFDKAFSVLCNQRTKRFVPGQLKTAIAKSVGAVQPVYEVVYLELTDPLERDGQSLPSTITVSPSPELITVDQSVQFEHNTYTHISRRPRPYPVTVDSTVTFPADPGNAIRYPSSVSIWRKQIRSLGKTDRNFLPLWMQSAQGTSINELGYTLCIPICYCKPGTSADIVRGIKNSGFDFSTLDLSVDRFVITRYGKKDAASNLVVPYNYNKYIIFTNNRTSI